MKDARRATAITGLNLDINEQIYFLFGLSRLFKDLIVYKDH